MASAVAATSTAGAVTLFGVTVTRMDQLVHHSVRTRSGADLVGDDALEKRIMTGLSTSHDLSGHQTRKCRTGSRQLGTIKSTDANRRISD
jgi:hypothetical protein